MDFQLDGGDATQVEDAAQITLVSWHGKRVCVQTTAATGFRTPFSGMSLFCCMPLRICSNSPLRGGLKYLYKFYWVRSEANWFGALSQFTRSEAKGMEVHLEEYQDFRAVSASTDTWPHTFEFHRYHKITHLHISFIPFIEYDFKMFWFSQLNSQQSRFGDAALLPFWDSGASRQPPVLQPAVWKCSRGGCRPQLCRGPSALTSSSMSSRWRMWLVCRGRKGYDGVTLTDQYPANIH